MCNLPFSLESDDKSVRSLLFPHKLLRLCVGLMKLRKVNKVLRPRISILFGNRFIS